MYANECITRRRRAIPVSMPRCHTTTGLLQILKFRCINKMNGNRLAKTVLFVVVHTAVVTVKRHSPYSITERSVPELIPVLGSQHAGDVSHKPGGRLPVLSPRPAVTLATLKRAATNFAVW